MSKENEIKKYTSKKEEKTPTSMINGISYDRFKNVFINNGWDLDNNVVENNIMKRLFNLAVVPNSAARAKFLELMNKRVYNLHDKNEV